MSPCRISDSYVHVRGTCYKYFAELKTYDEAQQTCAADGAVLAIPKDSTTNSFLAGMGGGDRWIGISDAQMEGQWVFADGQTLQSADYSNWKPACRISDSYVNVRGTCYKYFAETKTYDEAKQMCAADGAVLAMPKDSATNSFLVVPPVAVWPLDAKYGASDATGNGNNGTATGTNLAPGPYGNADGAFLFSGTSNSYVYIPNDGQLDVQYSYTILAHIYPTGQAGPIFRYAGHSSSVSLWQEATYNLIMRPNGRDGQAAPPIQAAVLEQNAWNFVGGTYDNTTGVGSIWDNGERVGQVQVGFSSVATQYDIRVAKRDGNNKIFNGRIACLQLYDYALTRDQILAARNVCRDESATENGGCEQNCTNVLGSYNCSCRQGFVLMADGHGCEVCGHCQGGDVNCDPISGGCSAGCQAGWKTQRCTQAVDPPVNLAVTDVTEGGFNVTWSPSRDPDLQGYRVVVLRLDQTTAVNHSTDRASCMVAGLPSETYYVIEVTSLVLSEGRRSQSEEAIVPAATGARSSTDLQFVEVTDFMLVFTWVPPDAAVTGYHIMYGQEEATERLIPSPGPDARSAVITGLQPDTMYKVEITTIGVYRESSPLVGQSRTAPVPTTPSPATTTQRTSQMTTVLSTSSSSSSTPAKTSESAGDQISSDDDDAGSDSDYYYDSEPEPPIPTTQSNEAATTATSSKSLDDVRQTSSYQPVEAMTTAAEEKTEEEKALDMLQSITSALDEVDMSDPATLESVGGSVLESVGALLEGPEEDAEEKPEDDGFAEDESLSPEERLQKAEQKKQENEAKRRNIVQESRRVLEKMENAMIKTLKPGDPPVSLTKGGVTLSAQKILGSEFGGQVVQTEEGGFQLPSQAALFSEFEHAPQSVTVKMKQFEQNPFTWGSGEHQARSSVMELSLQQDNNQVMTFRNLTEDFIITIPGNPKNKPATKIITIPSPGNRSARYHFYNLTDMAEGFLVTIKPLNLSVVYRVSGRRGGRPDDQNYDMSMETYLLPEQCSLTKSLSGDEGHTDKTKATMFIQGEEDPGEYYVKVQVLGPVTECGVENKSDPGDAYDFFAYEIQWARLRCLYWNDTQDAWMTDGCAISNQSSTNSTVCHCNHLTAFGSDFATPPNAIDFGNLEFSDLENNGAVFTTVWVVFCFFALAMVALQVMEKFKKKLNRSIKLYGLQDRHPYRLHIWTGSAKHAGTESTVAFKLFGDAASSDLKVVNGRKEVFARGSQVTLTFSTAEHLGTVELLQLMHDNSGEGSRASWHVDRAALQDLTTGKMSYFFCGEWLAADRGDRQVVKTFPVASEEDLRSFGFLFPASLWTILVDEHLVLSVVTMPEGSTFTRSERLGCCLSLLLMSMVSSAIWLRDEIETQVVQAISLGPFSFTLNEVYTGAMSSITCLPVVLAIVLLFQYSRPNSKGDSRVRDMETGDRPEVTTQQRPTKGLPHWCKYVAWVLVVLSTVGSAVFTVLYSLEWGKEKSERWLSAYFSTFLVDTFFSQPVKIMLLAIVLSTVRKTQAIKQIFEEKPATVSQQEEAMSSRMTAGLDCVAFRKERKMERLSMMSLLNVKEARMGKDRDRRFGVVLWGIVWYCLSLLLIIIIADAQHKTTPAFHQTQSATNSFVPSLDEVKGAASLWSWLNVTALESFYPDTSYNGGHLRWREKGFTADVQSVLVSPPSLMQGRVKPGLCTVPAAVQNEFEECSSGYDEHTKETGTFRKGWERVTNTSEVEPGATGWNYHAGDSLSLPIYGVTSQYWGDGFAMQLGKSADEMRSILADLKADGWIDKRTRVIFLEVMLYNGNPDMLTSLTVVFEFSETAGVFTQHHLHTFRFHQQPGTIGYIYVLLEIVYVIILLYTLWKEVNVVRAAGLAYLKDLWNVVEIFNFFLAFTVIALYGVNRACSSKALTSIRDGEDRVLHSRSMVKMNLVYGWFLSFLTFVSMLKLLRLLRFNPFLAKLASVFRAMAKEFLVFIIYFFIILSAFGASAYLTFGLIMKEYTTVTNSLSTLFQMSLGMFHFNELQEANPILGPIYFFGFICIEFLILMNVAMAIIDSALRNVRNHVMPKEDQEFIRGVWQRFTDFFGFRDVPVTGDDAMDRLYDSITEVEIKTEKLWLQRKTLFNCRVKDADLPTEPEFVPAVKDVPDAAAVELGVSKAAHDRRRVIEVRPAAQNNSTDGGCWAEASVAVAASSPSEGLSDSQNSHQTKQQHHAEAKAVTSPLNQLSKLTDGKVTSRPPRWPESLEKKRVRERRLALNSQTPLGKAETAARKIWVPGLTLTIFDRRVLTVGEMLTDDHIQAAQKLLRHQYPALQGLEEPAVGLCEDGFAKMTENGLQIHNNRAQHWVLSSHTDGQVCLYDSLGTAMTTSLQIQLCQVYAPFADRERHVLFVKRPTVQRQTNAVDCGLFAIAWAVDIAEGQDVSRVVYDDEKMRSHLEMCFKQEKLTPFPRLHGYIARAGPARVEHVSLVCRCAQGQGERLGRMGRCKVCRRILHVSCLPTCPAVDGTLSCGDCTV
ncbi:uncharacterized protein LOC144906058 [Branchiostoma floridae x Branchiostoma belcheri]